jgi:hypothetical protein
MDISKYRDFYKNEWNPGTNLTDDLLSSYIMRACDNIANALFILSVDNANVPAALDDTFCRAVCAETDYISAVGTGGAEDAEFDSIQIGSFRMSGIKQSSSDSGSSSKNRSGISPRTEEYLAKAGLYSRNVSVV